MAWVYMLRCCDGSYYVGSTTHLSARLEQHHRGGGAQYTRRRRPLVLVWSHETTSVSEAFALEKQIQNWSRAKREALIAGELGALPDLARGRTGWRRRD